MMMQFLGEDNLFEEQSGQELCFLRAIVFLKQQDPLLSTPFKTHAGMCV